MNRRYVMKKSALLLLGAFITLYACDKGPMESGLGMVDMSLTGLSTKVSVGDAGETAWTQGDALSVFTDTDSRDGSTNYRFQLVSSSDGGKSGRFSGKVVENAERSMVYAVYPYSESYASGTVSEMEIRMPAEQSASGISDYVVMTGAAEVSGDGSADVPVYLAHQTSLWDILLSNPDGKAVSWVSIEAPEAVFPVEGTFDLADAGSGPVHTSAVSAMKVTFDTPAASGQVLARFTMFPLPEILSDMEMTVIAGYSDGFTETFTRAVPKTGMQAGMRYHSTFTLGEGILSDAPDGWIPVHAGDNLRAKLNDAMDNPETDAVRLYLEASAEEALEYSLGANRIYPVKPLEIRGASDGIMPKISVSSGCTFEFKESADIEYLRLSNVAISTSPVSNSGFILVSAGDVHIGEISLENCELKDYKSPFLKTNSELSGISVDRIALSGNIFRWLNTSGSYAFMHLANNTDRIPEITMTDCTSESVFYYLYGNMNSSCGTDVSVTLDNCTFVNTRGNDDGYFISFQNGSLGGKVVLTDLLFGGTNNITGTYNMLRANNVEAETDNCWCTPSWKSFTDGGKNGAVDFLGMLPAEEDNDGLFTDLAGFDLTVKQGTSVRENGAGDRRWLK